MPTAKPKAMSVAGMPNGDVEAIRWMQAFAETLAREPHAYGISQQLSDRITQLVKAFDEAFWIAKSPDSNTAGNIRRKNEARSAAVLAIREAASSIRANPALNQLHRIALGLPVDAARKARRRMRDRMRRSYGSAA